MLSLYRISAIIFRHLMTMRRMAWIIEITYWTVLDIIVFGSLGRLTAQTVTSSVDSTAVMNALITNSVLWYVVFCSAITIGSSLLNEFFDANFTALFSTPLYLVEWIIATIFVGSIAALINVILGWIIALFMFSCNIYALGIATIVLIGSLMISSWVIGLLLMSVLLFIGKKGSGLAFVICWSLLPFSCIYYPIQALPRILQTFSFYVSMAHVFASVRESLAHGTIDWNEILLSFILNIIYLAVASIIFVFAFKKAKNGGLARLELGW